MCHVGDRARQLVAACQGLERARLLLSGKHAMIGAAS